jgi:hypothetical protein
MNINLQVTFTDQTAKEVSANAADMVAFEREFDLSVARLEKEVKLTHLLFMAWHAEKRTKSTTLQFEPWTETIEAIEATGSKK